MNGPLEPISPSGIEGTSGDPLRRATHDLRASALDLMRVLTNGIFADEALAEEIALIATDDPMGELDGGEALRAIVRNHRIRALEGRARLACVAETYCCLPLD